MSRVKILRHFFEKHGFAVSTRLADFLGMSVKSVRLFFIYASFTTLVGGFIIYLTLAFWLKLKDMIYTKRTSVFDLWCETIPPQSFFRTDPYFTHILFGHPGLLFVVARHGLGRCPVHDRHYTEHCGIWCSCPDESQCENIYHTADYDQFNSICLWDKRVDSFCDHRKYFW